MLERKALLKCSIHSLREPPAPCLSPRHTCELQTGSFITLTSETLASKVLWGTQREVSRVESGKGVPFQEVYCIPRFCRTLKKEIKKIMANGFV